MALRESKCETVKKSIRDSIGLAWPALQRQQLGIGLCFLLWFWIYARNLENHQKK